MRAHLRGPGTMRGNYPGFFREWITPGRKKRLIQRFGLDDGHGQGRENHRGYPRRDDRREKSALAEGEAHRVDHVVQKSHAHRQPQRREGRSLTAFEHQGEGKSRQNDHHISDRKSNPLMHVHAQALQGFVRAAGGEFGDVFVQLPDVHRGDIEPLLKKILRRFLDIHQLFLVDLDLDRAGEVNGVKNRYLALIKFPGDPRPDALEGDDLLLDVLVLVMLDDGDPFERLLARVVVVDEIQPVLKAVKGQVADDFGAFAHFVDLQDDVFIADLFGRSGGAGDDPFIDEKDRGRDQKAEDNGGAGDLPEMQPAGAHGDDLVMVVETAEGQEHADQTGDGRRLHQDDGKKRQVIFKQDTQRKLAVDDFIKVARNIDDDIQETKDQDRQAEDFDDGPGDMSF